MGHHLDSSPVCNRHLDGSAGGIPSKRYFRALISQPPFVFGAFKRFITRTISNTTNFAASASASSTRRTTHRHHRTGSVKAKSWKFRQGETRLFPGPCKGRFVLRRINDTRCLVCDQGNLLVVREVNLLLLGDRLLSHGVKALLGRGLGGLLSVTLWTERYGIKGCSQGMRGIAVQST